MCKRAFSYDIQKKKCVREIFLTDLIFILRVRALSLAHFMAWICKRTFSYTLMNIQSKVCMIILFTYKIYLRELSLTHCTFWIYVRKSSITSLVFILCERKLSLINLVLLNMEVCLGMFLNIHNLTKNALIYSHTHFLNMYQNFLLYIQKVKCVREISLHS